MSITLIYRTEWSSLKVLTWRHLVTFLFQLQIQINIFENKQQTKEEKTLFLFSFYSLPQKSSGILHIALYKCLLLKQLTIYEQVMQSASFVNPLN